MSDKAIELLPCPFCGGAAKMCEGMGDHWVRCLGCRASATMTISKAQAATEWNTRQAAKEQYAPKWVSVEDGLPTEAEEFLVLPVPNRDMNILTAEFQPWDKKWKQDFYNGYDYEEFEPAVTHWMPIPQLGDKQ